jgi:plastocyanin
MAQVTVTIAEMSYSPDPIEIKKGDTVVWSNQDGPPHTATADDGSFNTGRIPAGKSSKPITFNTAGKVPYHCTIHGPSMSGTVQVS